ncbi:MAG: hypothetical protein ACRCX4_10800 [Bacteroidales bacterium]
MTTWTTMGTWTTMRTALKSKEKQRRCCPPCIGRCPHRPHGPPRRPCHQLSAFLLYSFTPCKYLPFGCLIHCAGHQQGRTHGSAPYKMHFNTLTQLSIKATSYEYSSNILFTH